jgi:hypothetical protein
VAQVVVGELLVRSLHVHAGEQVLDVAGGAGNTALAAAWERVRFSARMPSMAFEQELSCLAYTDAGIVAVWSPANFATISDYDSWEAALLEDDDIIEHIARGNLVPICIGADGAWRLIVRWAAGTHRAELTNRERMYLVVSSEPYLFVSDGLATVSGYEKIDNNPGHHLPRLHIPPGRWPRATAVRICPAAVCRSSSDCMQGTLTAPITTNRSGQPRSTARARQDQEHRNDRDLPMSANAAAATRV